MELLEPEERVAQEEGPYFVAAVIEDERAPVLMLTFPRVGVLVERRAVEAGQTVGILREMAGHPVENHPDPVGVALVDEIPEVVRRAEPTRRRVKSDDLVPPRPGERVLHDREQLDVRIPHLADVRHERVRHLAIGLEAVFLFRHSPPRPEVHLVDRHRPLAPSLVAGAAVHPLVVAPGVTAVGPDDGR